MDSLGLSFPICKNLDDVCLGYPYKPLCSPQCQCPGRGGEDTGPKVLGVAGAHCQAGGSITQQVGDRWVGDSLIHPLVRQ